MSAFPVMTGFSLLMNNYTVIQHNIISVELETREKRESGVCSRGA